MQNAINVGNPKCSRGILFLLTNMRWCVVTNRFDQLSEQSSGGSGNAIARRKYWYHTITSRNAACFT